MFSEEVKTLMNDYIILEDVSISNIVAAMHKAAILVLKDDKEHHTVLPWGTFKLEEKDGTKELSFIPSETLKIRDYKNKNANDIFEAIDVDNVEGYNSRFFNMTLCEDSDENATIKDALDIVDITVTAIYASLIRAMVKAIQDSEEQSGVVSLDTGIPEDIGAYRVTFNKKKGTMELAFEFGKELKQIVKEDK